MENKDWFESWFNTHYYHILYKHRDETEAEFFIDNLLGFLNIPETAEVLDLACGRGRHAVYMHQKGLHVTGLDLSQQSIAFANQFKTKNLNFIEGDMRQDLGERDFQYIFNLFTSFGYFNTHQEHQTAISKVAKALAPKGFFILDFMNTHKVAKGLVADEKKEIDGLTFTINRKLENNQIIKTISFKDQQKDYVYKEKVAGLFYKDFEEFYTNCGLQIVNKFGDFCLSPFDINHSDRLILIAQKI